MRFVRFGGRVGLGANLLSYVLRDEGVASVVLRMMVLAVMAVMAVRWMVGRRCFVKDTEKERVGEELGPPGLESCDTARTFVSGRS